MSHSWRSLQPTNLCHLGLRFFVSSYGWFFTSPFISFDIFGGKMTSQSAYQIFFSVWWDIWWWFQKEVITRITKVNKFWKYAYPLKRYSVLKVQFSVILLLKIIAQNGSKFNFQNTMTPFEWIGIFLSNPHFIKNWHPLTLLNCDYKMATKAISNCIKSVIPQLINNDQTGFLK